MIIPSPHQSHRTIDIDAIIIHDTGSMNIDGTIQWFEAVESKVSAHYVVGLDGKVVQCVPDSEVAWHAGISSLHGRINVNDFSIGIELVNDGVHDYTDDQMGALIELCARLCLEYEIPLNRIVGHRDVAPGRKIDPGDKFPWLLFLLGVAGRIGEMLSDRTS